MSVRAALISMLPSALVSRLRAARETASLSGLAREMVARDARPLDGAPDSERAIDASLEWLCRAQDESATQDGGFARHFDVNHGWSASYPETTGYIIPTLLREGERRSRPDLIARARRATDWLCGIQLPDGGFQGGMVDQTPVVPVTFNTGQILLGLTDATRVFGDARYREATIRAARWLCETQDEDGAWRRFPSPFAETGEKAYETHVSWGLLEADRVLPGHGFGAAAQHQIRWALTTQDHSTGWFRDCCLTHPDAPLTHTIGYMLRGVLEGYRHTPDPVLLAAAERAASGIAGVVAPDGRLAGRLRVDWSSAVDWVCLTGTVQIAHCLLLLDQLRGDAKYRDVALRMNRYVRQTIRLDGPVDLRGGVKGSHPIAGDYGRFQYLNWAAKFAIDSFRLELGD